MSKYYCPFCFHEIDPDYPSCCGEFGHMITEEELEEYDKQEFVDEYELVSVQSGRLQESLPEFIA